MREEGCKQSSQMITLGTFTEHLVGPGPGALPVLSHQHLDEVGTTDAIIRKDPPSLPPFFSSLSSHRAVAPKLWSRCPTRVALLWPESTIKRLPAGCAPGRPQVPKAQAHVPSTSLIHLYSLLSLDQLPSQPHSCW